MSFKNYKEAISKVKFNNRKGREVPIPIPIPIAIGTIGISALVASLINFYVCFSGICGNLSNIKKAGFRIENLPIVLNVL